MLTFLKELPVNIFLLPPSQEIPAMLKMEIYFDQD